MYIGRSPLLLSKKPPTRSCMPPITLFDCADLAVTPEDPHARFSGSRWGFVKEGTFLGTEKVDISSTACFPVSYAWAPASLTLCVTFAAAWVAVPRRMLKAEDRRRSKGSRTFIEHARSYLKGATEEAQIQRREYLIILLCTRCLLVYGGPWQPTTRMEL